MIYRTLLRMGQREFTGIIQGIMDGDVYFAWTFTRYAWKTHVTALGLDIWCPRQVRRGTLVCAVVVQL